MRFSAGGDGGIDEQLGYANVEDVGDFPEALVRDAYLSPFDADNRPSVVVLPSAAVPDLATVEQSASAFTQDNYRDGAEKGTP